uniref:AGC-kinase C-terminal domain-containing protein n=1 Tax=Rodentolepis nana TaxID=102285 RepID=A0A0R3TFR7_RODNA
LGAVSRQTRRFPPASPEASSISVPISLAVAIGRKATQRTANGLCELSNTFFSVDKHHTQTAPSEAAVANHRPSGSTSTPVISADLATRFKFQDESSPSELWRLLPQTKPSRPADSHAIRPLQVTEAPFDDFD